MKLYCLLDEIAEEAGPIFECRNDAMALRVFENMKEENLPIGSKKSDFKLVLLGSYDRGDSQNRPSIQGLSLARFITNAVVEDSKDAAV